jgi:mono/diheme cytochrome c family protein
LAFASAALSSVALAEEERNIHSVPLLPLYQQECSACHIAYQPGMLPAGSWQRIVNNLKQHYGVNASLDEDTVKELEQWLTAQADRAPAMPVPPEGHAARSWLAFKLFEVETGHPPEDRITRSSWFWGIHQRMPSAMWRQLENQKAIKSISNCDTCHTTADKGNFSKHNVRAPAALKP